MATAVIRVIFFGVILGLTGGAGVLPDDPVHKAVGETVKFSTTLTSAGNPFGGIVWRFNGTAFTISNSQNHTVPGYEDRITLFPSTGALELRNLALNDSGEYSVSVFELFIEHQGTTTLHVYERVTDVEVIANSTDVVEGSSISLSCSISSGSSLSFLWMNHSSELTDSDRVQFSDGNSTLTITPVNRYNQGPFRCHASNPVSYGISDPFDLTVSYGPENTNLSVSPLQEHYAAGSDISLFCSADSRPDALFTWFLNGDQLPGSGSELNLTNVEESQSGDYTCQSFNEKTLRNDTSMQISLSVLELVSGVEVNANSIDVVEGSSVSLSCSVSSGSALSFLWMNHSSELTASDRVQLSDGNSTLTITPVNRYDQGPFRCHASNPVSYGISNPFNLPVSYGPENTNLSVSPLQEHYAAGSNISLFCSADSRPDALFTWFLNGDQLPGSGSELKLTNVKERQSGDYTCQSFNEKTQRSDTSMEFTVSVLERISGASVTPSTDQAIEGNSLNLTCDAAGSVFTREWMKGGLDLTLADHMTFHEGNRVLSFKHLQKTDRGEYSCEISNPISSMEAKHRLVVNYGPENVLIRGLTETLFGDIITLTCSAESVPPATYTWSLNGTEVHDAAVYTKRFAEFSDSGTYTCDARNNITGRSRSALHELTITEFFTDVEVTANSTDLVEGSSVSLSCHVSSGSPLSFLSILSFRWMNHSSELTASDRVQLTNGDSTLTITPVIRYDQGPFSCHVYHPSSNGSSDPVNLIISYGPENTNLRVAPLQEHYAAGSDISLFCSGDSRPEALFTWFLNGDQLPGSGSELKLTNVEERQSGDYTCQSFNEKTLRSDTSMELTVSVLERISGASVTPSTDQAIEGNSLNLTCDAAGSVFTREWMTDGLDLTLADHMTFHEEKRVLSFEHLQKTDRGEYSCEISNPINSMEAKHNLIVNYGPGNVQINGPNKIPTGDTIMLSCYAESDPSSSYTWSLNEKEIHHSAVYSKTEAEALDSGIYNCTAENNITGRTSSAVHKLTVTVEEGLSAGAIAGIVVACLLVTLFAIGGYFFYKKKFKKSSANFKSLQPTKSEQQEQPQKEEPIYETMPAGHYGTVSSGYYENF